MKTYEGKLVAPAEARFAIVVSRFNEFVTSKLLGGAVDALKRHHVAEDNIDVVWSPGSFEIPLLTQRLAASGHYAAVLCVGAVIRGGTDHHRYIGSEVAKGVAQAAQEGTVIGRDLLGCCQASLREEAKARRVGEDLHG